MTKEKVAVATRSFAEPELIITGWITGVLQPTVYTCQMDVIDGDPLMESCGPYSRQEIDNLAQWLSDGLDIPIQEGEQREGYEDGETLFESSCHPIGTRSDPRIFGTRLEIAEDLWGWDVAIRTHDNDLLMVSFGAFSKPEIDNLSIWLGSGLGLAIRHVEASHLTPPADYS